MKLKVIQVNIYMGKYLGDLIDFLNREKPDIVTMEEVTTKEFNLWDDPNISLFDTICRETGLKGVYDPAVELKDKPASTLGNAVISRFDTVGKEITVLKKFRPMTVEEFRNPKFDHLWPMEPKHLLDISLSVEGENIHVICWHGAWVPSASDTNESLRQSIIVADHLRMLGGPFILGGDLNVGPETKTVALVDAVSNNLMSGAGIAQTTHPQVHKIAPRGFLIDYIFTSEHFKKISIDAPRVLVSDHLPLVAELEFGD